MADKDRAVAAKRWLNREAREVRAPLVAAIAGGGINGGLLIAQAVVLAQLVTRTIFGHQPVASQLPLFGALLAIFALRAIDVHAGNRAAARAGLAVKGRTRAALISHIHALGPGWVTARQPGELANTVVDGVEALEAYYADYLPQAAVAVIVPLAILAVVFPVDWISGLILAGTAPVIPLFMIILGKGAAAMNERQWSRMARLSAHFYEVLAGLPILKSFGAGQAEAKLVGKLSEDYRASTMRVLRVAFLSSFALEFLATVSIAMVAVIVGFRLLWGEVAFSAGFTALLLAPEFYLPLRKLGDAYHARLAAVAAAEDIGEILATPVSTTTGTRHFRPRSAFAVAVEHARFSYPDASRPALEDVSFEIAAGRHTAIVGPSGAGKSTLAHLLLGFARPDAGRILVDGEPLQDLALDEWRSRIAWVPQRAHLFAGTLAENIAIGIPDASREAIVDAARNAHADEFIARLARGYDTPIGEGGSGLSGGEIQRIAVARAFLRNAPLVILDEPTASLDGASEAAIVKALETLKRGRTVLTIAHRLNTVRHADRIVVLDNGRVAGVGTHAALVRQQGLYWRLLRATVPAPEPEPEPA